MEVYPIWRRPAESTVHISSRLWSKVSPRLTFDLLEACKIYSTRRKGSQIEYTTIGIHSKH